MRNCGTPEDIESRAVRLMQIKKTKNTCKYLFPSFACIRSALVFCLFILTGLNMYHKYSTET